MRFFNKACWLAGAGLLLATAAPVLCQWYPAGRESKLGAMLDEGLVTYQTPELALRLVRSSGTAAALEAPDLNTSPNSSAPQARPLRGAKAFDFIPAELLAARSVDGYYHLGDLDLRLTPADAYTPRARLRRPANLPWNAEPMWFR